MNKPKKMFCFDLDGTIAHKNSDGSSEISARVKSLLSDLSRQHHLVIATGRRFRTCKALVGDLPVAAFVNHNGLAIYSSVGELQSISRMRWEDAHFILQALAAEGEFPGLFLDSQLRSMEFAFLKNSLSHSYGMNALWKERPEACLVLDTWEDLKEYSEHILEIGVWGQLEQLENLSRQMNSKLPKSLQSLVLRRCSIPNVSMFDIFNRGSTKWTGIVEVSKRLKPTEIICVGDDANDLEMIQNADLGIAMSHAPEFVKEKAALILNGPDALGDWLLQRLSDQ